MPIVLYLSWRTINWKLPLIWYIYLFLWRIWRLVSARIVCIVTFFLILISSLLSLNWVKLILLYLLHTSIRDQKLSYLWIYCLLACIILCLFILFTYFFLIDRIFLILCYILWLPRSWSFQRSEGLCSQTSDCFNIFWYLCCKFVIS